MGAQMLLASYGAAAADGVAAPTLTGSPTLLAHWDFDKSSTVTLSGSDIDSIATCAGGSYTLLTPGAMPAQVTRSGKKWASFVSASSQFMQIASACGVGANGCTLVIVYYNDSLAANGGLISVADRTAASDRNRHDLFNSAGGGLTMRRGSASALQAAGGGNNTVGLHIGIGRSGTGTVNTYLHDDGRGTAIQSAGTISLPGALTHTTIGAKVSASTDNTFFDGDIACVLIYENDIGSTASEELAAWATTNYGTTNQA